jgi:hypothetical protein
MEAWRSITRSELDRHLASQAGALSPQSAERFSRYRVEPWLATIRRDDVIGDEKVYVVAQDGALVVFFDEVEGEFAVGIVNEAGRLSNFNGFGDLSFTLFEFPERYADRRGR